MRWSRRRRPRRQRYGISTTFTANAGAADSTKDRRGVARVLWRQWSPTWAFDDATFDRTASAFDNPDFVDVVIHSYRHRYGLVAGDPAYAEIEAALAAQPPIAVAVHHDRRRCRRREPRHGASCEEVRGPHEHRVFKGAGHNLPQERPRDWARAVIDARAMALG